jgi:hypothetical protein
MANGGWYGTKEEWDRLEQPLTLLDDSLTKFATNEGISVSRNLKDWPERSLVWGKQTRCLIQIYLIEESALKFNFWICASQDRDLKRFWKNEFVKERVSIEEIRDDLPFLLSEAKRKLDEWATQPEQLEFVAEIHSRA